MQDKEAESRGRVEEVSVKAVEAIWEEFPEGMQHLTGAFGVVIEPRQPSEFTKLVNAERSQSYRREELITDSETALFMATLRQAEREFGGSLLDGPKQVTEESFAFYWSEKYRLNFRVQMYLNQKLPALYKLYFIRYQTAEHQRPMINLIEDMPDATMKPPLLVPKGLSLKSLWQEAADEVR